MPAKRGFTIEERIKPLVDALNSIGYIRTFSSCEGHYEIYDSHSFNNDREYAEVMFEIDNGKEKDLENLIFNILGEVSEDFNKTTVDIFH